MQKKHLIIDINSFFKLMRNENELMHNILNAWSGHMNMIDLMTTNMKKLNAAIDYKPASIQVMPECAYLIHAKILINFKLITAYNVSPL